MARRYDSKTTSFSSEGRLMQVEYAFENVNKSTPTLGILTKEGIVSFVNSIGVVLAAKKLVLSKLLSKEKMSEKMYMIDDHIICSVCGMASDALVLVEEGRKRCQEYFYTLRSQFLWKDLLSYSVMPFMSLHNTEVPDLMALRYCLLDMTSTGNSSCFVLIRVEIMHHGRHMCLVSGIPKFNRSQ